MLSLGGSSMRRASNRVSKLSISKVVILGILMGLVSEVPSAVPPPVLLCSFEAKTGDWSRTVFGIPYSVFSTKNTSC